MGPPGVPGVPILGPARGMFSKLNGPGPLGSVGHSHTSFRTGEFRTAQRTLGSDVQQFLQRSRRCEQLTHVALLLGDQPFRSARKKRKVKH